MRVEELSFRELYHQICLLSDADLVKSINLRDVFEFPLDEKLDAFLTYACIDDGIFIFEILAGAKVSGGRIKIFPGSYKKSAKLKRGQVDNAELRIVTAEYALPFRDRIYMIDDRIDAGTREETRLIKNLDAFRHPDYPDDVVVYFFSAEEQKPELLWVRCISVDENILNGELLNEPTKNFGCHVGDKIKFGVAQIGEQNILLYLPTGGNALE